MKYKAEVIKCKKEVGEDMIILKLPTSVSVKAKDIVKVDYAKEEIIILRRVEECWKNKSHQV